METLPPDDFEGDRLRRPGRAVVAFVAEWCPFCRSFFPEFAARAAGSGVPFAYADISDEEDPRWERFGIEVVPTVLGFEEGRIAWRVDGIFHQGMPWGQLDPALRRWSGEAVPR